MGPREPNVTAVNKYGGWNMSPSNVFFSNGECEPWIVGRLLPFAFLTSLASR